MAQAQKPTPEWLYTFNIFRILMLNWVLQTITFGTCHFVFLDSGFTKGVVCHRMIQNIQKWFPCPLHQSIMTRCEFGAQSINMYVSSHQWVLTCSNSPFTQSSSFIGGASTPTALAKPWPISVFTQLPTSTPVNTTSPSKAHNATKNRSQKFKPLTQDESPMPSRLYTQNAPFSQRNSLPPSKSRMPTLGPLLRPEHQCSPGWSLQG